MFNQLAELEALIIKLEQVTSIFNIMCPNYFDATEPNSSQLINGYTDYSRIIDLIRDMIHDQSAGLHDSTNRLYKIHNKLRKLAEQNIALLKGGASND